MARRVTQIEWATEPMATEEEIVRSPYWWALRGALIRALRPYPEAAAAVVAVLEELGAGEDPAAAWRRARRR